MENSVFKRVQQILIIILIANIVVAISKLIIGLIIKSASISADGLHSLTDGSSNIVGLIGIQFASKPKDNDHPYGHYKFETLSGLFIAAMLFMIGVKVILGAIYRFKNPVELNISIDSLIILIFTLCINIVVSITEYKKGIELNSQILISDSMHTRSDIFVSLGVLITLIGIKLGLPSVIDPITSLVVSMFILHASYEVYKENVGVLVDKSVVDTEEIKNIVLSIEQVKDVHKIRSRGSKNDIHIDLHILVDPNLSVKKSHELVHYIEEIIKEKVNKNAQVIAHIEPFELKNENLNLRIYNIE